MPAKPYTRSRPFYSRPLLKAYMLGHEQFQLQLEKESNLVKIGIGTKM